jgi:hypothetical protein
MLPVALCVCETWSPTEEAEEKFGTNAKRDEVTGLWRKVDNKSFCFGMKLGVRVKSKNL